jgi:hypothetical protein
MFRPNKITLSVGARGTSKTTAVTGNKQFNVPSLAEKYIKKGMSVLILDLMDHPAYRGLVEDLAPGTNFLKLKPKIYRVIADAKSMPAVFQILNKDLWNCYLVCEDAYRYIPEKIPDDLMAILSNSKQKNVESLFMFHSWGMAPKDIFRLPPDDFEVYYSAEHPSVRKKELSGCYDRLLKAWERCDAQFKKGNKFYHETVSAGV